jgi:hypothetical protein
MKLFVFLTLAVSFVLIGCGEKAADHTAPTVPSTNAVPAVPAK